MNSSDAELTIVAAEPIGVRRGAGDAARRLVETHVSVEVLQANLGGFIAAIRDLLTSQATRAGAFSLDEVGLSVEVGADGQVKLLGAGVSAHGTSGLHLTWRRGPDEAAGT
jgi:hypothetical protein